MGSQDTEVSRGQIVRIPSELDRLVILERVEGSIEL